ncbi:MAG: AAA family ATPase, partial [Halothece sp. Uz-M2-17]|nr:AAA family ATPase [Halothece sp. Uz-M2-17]
MFCHILIGCPSSGKSTLAASIQKANPNYQIVSTDAIRADLFGDAT